MSSVEAGKVHLVTRQGRLGMNAHKFRCARLKNLRVALEIARQDANIWRDVKPVITHGRKAQTGVPYEQEEQRVLTAFLRGMYLNSNAAWLLDQEIDRQAELETQRILGCLRNGVNYVPQVVIGNGLSGAGVAVELLYRNSEIPSLMIDAGGRIGGTFGKLRRPAWGLNNRTRPDDPNLEAIPGTPGSIAPIARHAPLNLADLSCATYASQADWGKAIRTDAWLSGHQMVGTKVKRITNQMGGQPFYRLDVETDGESRMVETDRMFLTTGLGTEQFIKDGDEETQRTIDELRGSQVFGLWDFMEAMTSDESMFHGEAFADKRIILVGGGDSAKIVLKQIFGHMATCGKSVAQLHYLKQPVVWIGAPALTKEEYVDLDVTRPVYMEIGVNLPQEADEDAYARIEPRQGRVDGLRCVGGDVFVYYKDKRGNFDFARGNVVIFTTGFEEEISGLYQPKLFFGSPDEITKRSVRRAFETEGSRIFYQKGFRKNYLLGGNLLSLEVIRVESNVDGGLRVTVRRNFVNGGNRETIYEDLGEVFGELQGTLANPTLIAELEIPYTPALEEVYDPETGEVVALRYMGELIYLVGPVSKIPLNERERDIPALRKIKENSAGAFRYQPRIVRLVEILEDSRPITARVLLDDRNLLLKLAQQEEEVVELSSTLASKAGVGISLPEEMDQLHLPSEVDLDVVGRYVIMAAWGEYRFDEYEIMMDVVRRKSQGGGFLLVFEFVGQPKLPVSVLADRLQSSRLGQKWLAVASRQMGSKTIEIKIDVQKGKIYPENIEIVLPRRTGR